MNENMIPFAYGDSLVRAVMIEDEVHFVGKDVCERLGYTNPNKAMADHCRGITKRYPIVDALGRTQEVRILSEPDVLRLIVRSKRPEAEAFERWVFEEVLPSIRKTGSYRMQSTSVEINAPDWFSIFARVLGLFETLGESAAQEEWQKSGLAFPMPKKAGVRMLMEATLKDRAEYNSPRAVSSRHNGMLGGRPRSKETAAEASQRRFHMVGRDVVTSEDGKVVTVVTYGSEDGLPYGRG